MIYKVNKLALAINGLRYGGMERQLVEFIKVLHSRGIEITLLAMNKPGPLSEIIAPYIHDDIVYLDRSKSRILHSIFRIWQLLRNIQPDIVHVQDNFSTFYVLFPSKLLGIPLVNGSIRHAGVSQGWDYTIERIYFMLSNIIIANSQAGLDYFHIKRGHVIYNLADFSRFGKTTGALTEIVMNANFHHLKDYTTFFKAMKKLNEKGRVTKVGLIGDGPTRLKYLELVQEWGLSGITTFYGFIDNVEETLTHYGIGVLSSTLKYKEGISNSLLEYMATGLIAVGSNVGGTAELVKDKVSGFLFEAENADSLVAKIVYIQDHPELREGIVAAALKQLAQNHSPENNVNKYMGIVNNYLK